ncbi:MAG: hypothetical protein J6U45_06450 [Alistipes sp.]|nr:hypothetical protein [Alistipes sp.]
MRKILIVAILLCVCFTANSQTNMNVPEPEFVGEVIVVRADSTALYQTLPKERASKRTVASATMYLIGLGDVKTKLSIKEHYSPLQISDEFEYKFIVKAISNEFDPISIIRFFKLEREGDYEKRRTAVLLKDSSLGALETNTREFVNFTAKKYGESSYILTVKLSEGEYGITVNSVDEANSVVATFGVFDHVQQAAVEREIQMQEAAKAEKEAAKAERKAKRMAK